MTFINIGIETPSGAIVDRADPYAFFSEIRPGTASRYII